MGQLVSIVHTPEGIDPRPPDHYARVPLETVTLEAGRGILGDRKGTGRERQLNIMAAQTLAKHGRTAEAIARLKSGISCAARSDNRHALSEMQGMLDELDR